MGVDNLVPAQFDCDPDRRTISVTLSDETVIEAIGSATARRILTILRESPRPVSNIAAELDASIQSISYHVDRLEAAGVVTTVATTYSEKGKTMDIYAATTSEIVIELDSPTDAG